MANNDFDLKINPVDSENDDGGIQPQSIIETITWSILASPTITTPFTSGTVSNYTENKDCY